MVQSGRGCDSAQSAGFDGDGVGAVVDEDFDLAGKLREAQSNTSTIQETDRVLPL